MKPFLDLLTACHSLLDRWERSDRKSGRLFSYINYPTDVDMLTIEADERLSQKWAAAITVIDDPKVDMKIRLKDADALYKLLERPDPRDKAAEVDELAKTFAEYSVFMEALEKIHGRWSQNKKWRNIEPGDTRSVAQLFECALAVRKNKKEMDYRTFLTQHRLPSKYIERRFNAITDLLVKFEGWPQDLRPEMLKKFGLSKIPQPLLLRGDFLLDGRSLLGSLSYAGFDPLELLKAPVALRTEPKAVILIENMVSFVRFCQSEDRVDTIVFYTGGFPASTALDAIKHLIQLTPPSTPLFHWGDIDGAGITIFEHLHSQLETIHRNLKAAGMNINLLKQFGHGGLWAIAPVRATSPLKDVALAINQLRLTVEQEAIDPKVVRQEITLT